MNDGITGKTDKYTWIIGIDDDNIQSTVEITSVLCAEILNRRNAEHFFLYIGNRGHL